ncbi:RNA polymerase sigma-70 factor (ECF subfamily) [Rhodovulum sulfidophilum]|nr:RNA polymerase sigma-70 factor (ECF subfamily) [Rhodovulum sulfidophilum]
MPRNNDMLHGSHASQKPDEAGALPPYLGFDEGPVSTAEARVVTERQTADTQWVTCVDRIGASRDQAAFARLFAHFAPRVKAFLMKSGADEALAEECAQEVMATVWHKAHLFDPERASVATWIFTIARNRRIDVLRKQRRPEPEDLPWGPDHAPDQSETVALQQETEQLGRALEALPEAQRVLIERAYFGELSHREIAAETGLPLGTIKSRIRLALDRLRHEMT